MKEIFWSVLILAGLMIPAKGQDIKAMQEQFIEAEGFFVTGYYDDALAIYLNLYKDLPDNSNLAYRIGVCYLNLSGKKNIAPEYLEKAVLRMSSRQREGTILQTNAPYDALFQLGNAYRVNYQFDRAKSAYTQYRETLLPDDRENINFIDHLISVCDNAKKMISEPVNCRIEIPDIPLPEGRKNYNPVISYDGNTFAWMTSLPFYNAVMISTRQKGKWLQPENITPWLRPDGQIFISSLSSDGSTLFFSMNDMFNSDIYSITRTADGWTEPARAGKNINTKYWESQAFITDDGNYILFSSDRPGGFGGLDLYISRKENNNWGTAINMGPIINTPFNEDRPCLIENGTILFFTSQGHENMGGYDIFKSEIEPGGIWSKPVNLGFPVNTPDDNIFFAPVEKGKALFIYDYRQINNENREGIYYIVLQK